MRHLENVLLIIGATALGATSGALGLTLFGLLTIFRDRPGQEPGLNWGAYFGAIGGLLCGGALGAVIGFMAALSAVSRRDDRPWKPATWLGIFVGLIGGVAVCLSGFPSHSDAARGLLTFWPTASLFVISAATCGGLLGNVVFRIGRGSRRPQRQKP